MADKYLDGNATGENNGSTWEDAWQDSETDVDFTQMSSGDTLWVRGNQTYGGITFGAGNVAVDGVNMKIDPDATAAAVFNGLGKFNKLSNSTIDGRVGENDFFKFLGPDAIQTVLSAVVLVTGSTSVTFLGCVCDRQTYYDSDTQPSHGFFIANSTGQNELLVFDRCHVHYASGDGWNINQASSVAAYDRYIIRNCTATEIGDDGVYTSGQTSVHNCNFAAAATAKFNGHPDAVQGAIGATHNKVYNNVFTGFGQEIFLEKQSGYVQIYNNVLLGYKVGDTGIVFSMLDYTTFTGDCVVANNTLYNFTSSTAAQIANVSSYAGTKYVSGNVFLDCKYIASGDPFLDSTNIYFNSAAVQYLDNPGGNPVSTPADQAAADCTYADPLLVDPANGDVSLSAGSPAIGAATVLSSFFTTDIVGAIRGPQWDSGAYEFEGLDVPTAPTNLTVTAI